MAVGGIFGINVDGTDQRLLTAPILDQASLRSGYARIFALLRVVPDWTNNVLVETDLVQFWKLNYEPRPEVRRLDFFTGKSKPEEKNPGNVVQWLAANDGAVRAAIARNKDDVELLYRDSKEKPWRVIHRSKTQDRDLIPRAVSEDGKHLYVAAHDGQDTLGVYLLNPETQELGSCLWRDERFDVHSCLFSSKSHLVGVFFESDKLRFKGLTPESEKLQSDVDEALPRSVNIPISRSRDGSRSLYFSSSDRDPGSYYLVDTQKREFGVFARRCPWLTTDQMVDMQPIEYKARDGLVIHGYLSIPPGSSGKNLPLVVLPHGGPNERDSWRFDSTVQFLANRGYAVLQMNFRGSTGYGLKFMRAGFKEWGGKMQDDITDGVKWAIAEGIADRNRIAIFGASYGGYAALMGLIGTPELFRCGISYAGVTDVRALTRGSLTGELRREEQTILRQRIGDYRADQKHLDAISPVRLVEKIQAPILLAYGAKDPKVKIEQARDLAKALKKKRKKFELIIEPNEGHGFFSEKAQTNLFNRIEAFLKENL
jgi:dipeptidyl aminopeptidase/acylaminoacyl peptidase